VILGTRMMNTTYFAKTKNLLLLTALYLVSTSVLANWQDNYHIHGYDPVSYFQNLQPSMGSTQHTTSYQGNNYAFANASNLETFEANPERYVPQYAGNCAFGMAYGKKTEIDPLVYMIQEDRLFFMINASTQNRWSRKSAKYIRKSDFYWDKLNGKKTIEENSKH